MAYVKTWKGGPRQTFVPYNGKIGDLTHADTNRHELTVANPAGTGAIAGETRKIIMLILGAVRMAGAGSFSLYPNEGATGSPQWTTDVSNPHPIVIANDSQRVQYSLSVAGNDWDLYCMGYVVEA